MKRSSASERALQTYYKVLKEFLENLLVMFPGDGEIDDCLLYVNNVVIGNPESMVKGIETWCQNMAEPLPKGSAKYMKAIESITGKPALVYHAFAYRDASVMFTSSSSPTLKRLNLAEKLNSGLFDEASLTVFWEYIDEMTTSAYRAISPESKWAIVPTVPTRADIQEDIARRKSAACSTGSASAESAQTVDQGIFDAFKRLCSLRGVSHEFASSESIAALIESVGKKSMSTEESNADDTLSTLCQKKRDEAFFAALKNISPTANWGDGRPTPEEWDLLNKCMGLSCMRSAIPEHMMSGIESMANKLMSDITSGRVDMSTLNVEAIGHEVLSSVSPEDMNAFANNVDKILPVLNHLNH